MIFTATEAQALLHPAHLAFNQLKALVQEDHCLQLNEPVPSKQAGGKYFIRVDVCSNERAAAWQLLKKELSGATVDLQFFFDGKPAEKAKVVGTSPMEKSQSLTQIAQQALDGNKYFYQSLNTNCLSQPTCLYPFAVTVEMEPAVIQTFVDNIYELHGNQNLTAADHLSRLLVDRVDDTTISFTTKKK